MLETIIILSLFCYGVQLSTEPSMIFYPIRKFIILLLAGEVDGVGEPIFSNNFQKYLYKPLMGCLPCMASVWGGTGYIILKGFHVELLIAIPAIACCNFFLNIIESKLTR